MPKSHGLKFSVANFKTALAAASTAANLAGVPLVQIVIGGASTLLDVIETVQSNKEDCESIGKTATELVIAITKSLSGKHERNLEQGLREQVETLGNTLIEISEKLVKIAGHGRLRRAWTSKADRKDIQDLKTDIWSAAQMFQVQFNIHQGLLSTARHDEVMEGITRIAVLSQASQDLSLYAEPPAVPAIFYGRDEYVLNAVSIILKCPARLAILGPGGIGKTSVAIMVMHHSNIESHFGHARFFVPCEAASTAALLLTTLMQVVKVKTSEENPLKSLLDFLKTATQLLLVLDNFETPWNGETRNDVEVLLGHLASVNTLSLIITMRGNVYPTGLLWTNPHLSELPALDADAAKLAYLKNYSKDDSALDELLKEIDYIPLAITLIAKVAESERLYPSEMLKKWRKCHTALLKTGSSNRLSNLDVSISLSTKQLEKQPEALQLLALVCTLPDGIFHDQWPAISSLLGDEGHAELAAQTLRQTSLCYKDSTHELHALSPICYYVQKNHKIGEELHQQLRQLYFSFAAQGHNYASGKRDKMKLLTEESGNIAKLLVEKPITMDADHIDAILAFSKFLYHTYPSCELLCHALQNCSKETPTNLKGELLYWLGNMYFKLCEGNNGTSQLQAAKQQFESISDKKGIAQCQKRLADVSRMLNQYDEAAIQLQGAMEQYENIGYKLGAAQCQQSLGDIARMLNQYDKATIQLQAAKEQFESIGDTFGIANCQRSLGYIASTLNKYDEAIIEMQAAKKQYESINDKLGVTQCQKSLGDIAYMLHQYDDAAIQLQAAKRQYESMGYKLGVAQCQQSLGNTACMLNQYDEATIQLQIAKEQFESIGNILGAAQCQKSMGDIACMLNEYDRAVMLLQVAKQQLESIGNKLGAAQCQKSLGGIACILYNYNEATIQLQGAKEQFESIGQNNAVAQCDKLLNHITERTLMHSNVIKEIALGF